MNINDSFLPLKTDTNLLKNTNNEVSGSFSNAVKSSESSGQFDEKAGLEPEPTHLNRVNEISDADALLQSINEQFHTLQSYLMFEKDQETDKMIFFIKNSDTDEIIRQIPSEELLAISKNISNYLQMVNELEKGKTPPVGLLTNEMV